MNTVDRLLDAHNTYAAAARAADDEFDLLNFPNLPQRPSFTAEAAAGELIRERGLVGALRVAEFGIEDPDCSEQTKEAYQLIIQAAR